MIRSLAAKLQPPRCSPLGLFRGQRHLFSFRRLPSLEADVFAQIVITRSNEPAPNGGALGQMLSQTGVSEAPGTRHNSSGLAWHPHTVRTQPPGSILTQYLVVARPLCTICSTNFRWSTYQIANPLTHANLFAEDQGIGFYLFPRAMRLGTGYPQPMGAITTGCTGNGGERGKARKREIRKGRGQPLRIFRFFAFPLYRFSYAKSSRISMPRESILSSHA